MRRARLMKARLGSSTPNCDKSTGVPKVLAAGGLSARGHRGVGKHRCKFDVPGFKLPAL